MFLENIPQGTVRGIKIFWRTKIEIFQPHTKVFMNAPIEPRFKTWLF